MDRTERLKTEQKISTKKVIVTSFVVDFLDVVLSFIITLLSGSVIMLTQVLEGISDLVSSGLLLIGLKRSMQREDNTHPFGYGREIYFWSFLAAIIMFGSTATFSFYFGWQRFMNPEPVENLLLALIILIITFITNSYAFILSCRRLLRSRPLKHIFRIFYRSSLVETKTTFILDLMGASASLLGAVALGIYVLTGDMRFDGLGAMIIGVILAIFALFLVAGIRELLVGRRASEEIEAEIIKAALSVKEVKQVIGLKTLHVGLERLLIDLDVHMEQELSTEQLERLIDAIKEKIREKDSSARYIQVELEAPRKK
jgi:cation diffusion facilitator family transporter